VIPDYFTVTVALRHLRYGRGETLLTTGVVAMSVTLIIFLTGLIGGLQRRLIATVTGAVAHISVEQVERPPIALWEESPEAGVLYTARTVKLPQQKQKIEDWQAWLPRLERFDPEVIAVSPTVSGQGTLARGTKKVTVQIYGVIPERQDRVVALQGNLARGRFFGLNGGELTMGYRLAEELGVDLGDKLRLTSTEDVARTYTVAGIFDTGFRALDSSTVYLPLRDGQSLFGLGTAVTSLGMRLRHVFEAEELARRLSLRVPYQVEPWTRDNQSLLVALKAQSGSSNMILAITTLAAAFGIASIMITAVVSRSKEIGILKAMGATDRQILGVFALEGCLLSLLGGVLGSATGLFLVSQLKKARTLSASGRSIELFPVELTPEMVLGAVGLALIVGLLSSLFPAWQAARVDPIEVIRGS
jgi:lipoprotein-releasing system permease protein